MIDIEKVKLEIVDKLKPFNPDKIILFGSYAYGTPNKDSDIDIFLLKDNLLISKMRDYKLQLQKELFDIQKKYLLGIDLFIENTERMKYRIDVIKDQFYKEIVTKGKVIYGK